MQPHSMSNSQNPYLLLGPEPAIERRFNQPGEVQAIEQYLVIQTPT